MKIILIAGKAQAGKDTLAKALEESLPGKQVLITHFADELKFVAKQFWDWDGKKDDAGRKLLQAVGDMYREADQFYWPRQLGFHLKLLEPLYQYCFIPDLRYEEEQYYISKNFCDVESIFLIRNGRPELTPENAAHSSEQFNFDCNRTFGVQTYQTMDEIKKVYLALSKIILGEV